MDPIEEPQINVIDPSGKVGSLPQSQAQEAISQGGYTPASEDQVLQSQKEQEFGGAKETLKAAAEGAISSTTFGLGTGLEVAAGVPLKNIRSRAEVNPTARQVGEVAGLVGQEFIPGMQEVGAQKLMSKAGQFGAEALGLAGETALAKVGSTAVKSAIENSMFQGGEELSKMFYGDPNQSAQTAAVDIGLGGLLGGGVGAAFGAVSPLWKASTGEKLGGFLRAVQKKANGESIALEPEIAQAMERSGLQVDPVLKSALSDDPELRNMYQTLVEEQTSSGIKTRELRDSLHEQAHNTLFNSIGKSAEDVANYSENKQGHEAIEVFKNEFQNKYKPIEKEYDEITKPFQNMPLTAAPYGAEKGYRASVGITDSLAEKIAQMAEENGYNSPSSPAKQILGYLQEQLPKQGTLQDLSNLSSRVGQQTFSEPALRDFGKKVTKSILDAQNDFLESQMGAKGAEAFERFKNIRSQYSDFRRTIDNLSSELSLGRSGGAKDFLMRLDQKRSPEDFLKKLSPKGNADIISYLRENGFQGTLEKIRENELFKTIGPSIIKAPKGTQLSSKTLFNAINKMSPEARDFAFSPKSLQTINGIQTILKALPERINPSGTAGTISKLFSKLPSSAMAIASMAMGHNPALGFLFGKTAEWLGRDAPSAMRHAFLKFLGHDGPVDTAGFKAMVDYIHATVKGENTLSKGVKGVFKASREVLPQSLMPTEKQTEKLDKRLQSLKDNPNSLFEDQGNTSYYLPDHGQAISATQARAVQYLNGLRPSTDKMSILGKERTPSKFEMTKYNRALKIAESPMLALQHVKDGTLVPQDIVTLKTIYPDLYGKISQKMFNELTEMTSKGESIPYKTKFGLSMFLGTPLDGSMTPFAINQSQLAHQTQNAQNQMKQQGGPQKGSPKALEKLSGMYQTGAQSRDAQRASKG